MLLKKLPLFFLIAFILSNAFCQASDNMATELRIYTQRLNTIEGHITSKEEIPVKQLNEYRKEVLETINALEDLQNRLDQKIQRSAGESKKNLEQQMNALGDTLLQAKQQLRILDKEILHEKALRYTVIENPLYKPLVLKNAYLGAIQATKYVLTALLQSAHNIVQSVARFPFMYYWIIWVILSIVLAPFAIWARRKWGYQEEKINFLKKIRALIVITIAESLYPLLIIGGFLFIGFLAQSIQFRFEILLSFYIAISFIWLSNRFTFALLKPKNYDWAVIHIDKKRSTNLARRISLFTLFLAIRLWLDFVNDPPEFTQCLEFIAQVFLSIQAFIILPVTGFGKLRKTAIGFLAIVAPIAIFVGLNALADLILSGTVLTVLVYLVLKGIHFLIKKGFFFLYKNPRSILTHAADKDKDKSSELMLYWSNAIFGIILFFVGIYATLIVWGIDQSLLNDWVSRLLFGFTIGSHTFSLVNVLFAILVFLFFFSLTRYSQTVLQKHVFPYTRFDTGLKHALKTTTGYIGFAITLILTVKTLGLDLSSILFVVGGLSVGIGLGLQPIVTNFISGLIMLIERPIKIGDCIEIGPDMGIIKKINVRTTEIETFDQCSVLLPNSQVINTTVKNWTKNNRMRRLEILIGVGYDSDTRKVQDLLLNCVQNHPMVLKEPKPFVVFSNFNEYTLDFSVRVYIGDLSDAFATQTALRHEIYSVLRENQVSVPVPQTDVHFDREFVAAFKREKRSDF